MLAFSLVKDQAVTASCLLSLWMVERIPGSLLTFSPGKYADMEQLILVALHKLIPSSSDVCSWNWGGPQCPLFPRVSDLSMQPTALFPYLLGHWAPRGVAPCVCLVLCVFTPLPLHPLKLSLLHESPTCVHWSWVWQCELGRWIPGDSEAALTAAVESPHSSFPGRVLLHTR